LLGGVFNVLVAPVAFDTVVEYPIALIIACLLRPSKPTTHRRDRLLDFVLPALFAAAFVLLFRSPLSAYLGWAVTLAAAALYVLCCLAYLRRPLRFALGVAAVLVGLASATETDSTKLFDTRSFFGVHRVRAYATHHSLQHGTTAHGAQSTIPELRREPLMYFHREGPLGDVFANVLLDKPIRRVAIIGLGTGSIACYGRAQEHWTFYEIDPVVVEIASDPRYFSFMRDCAPRTDVVLGDARLSLNDTPDAEYDLIILDAFTSDAIPAHLMTREALALYLRKLAPGGSIVFHISNRYLRLEPVVARLAEDAQLAFVYRAHLSVTAEQRARYVSNSKWAVLSRSAADHADLARQPGWERLPTNGGVSLWTDDFSDILSVFSW
jgi:SAM-dependent methyltransferase